MKFRTTCALIISGLALSVVATAQVSQTTGALRGTVKSKKSGAVRGATLLLRNTETGFTRTITSDATGAFQFPQQGLSRFQVGGAALAAHNHNRLRGVRADAGKPPQPKTNDQDT